MYQFTLGNSPSAIKWSISFSSGNTGGEVTPKPISIESSDSGELYMALEDLTNGSGPKHLIWLNWSISGNSIAWKTVPGKKMKIETDKFSVLDVVFYAKYSGDNASSSTLDII